MKKYAAISNENIHHWYKTCKANQQPYITVTLHGNEAIISWDYIHFEKDTEQLIRFQSAEAGVLLKSMLIQHGEAASMLEGNILVGILRGIHINHACTLAEQIFDLMNGFAKKYSPQQKHKMTLTRRN